MDNKAVGAKIKLAREAKHLTQEDLAAMVDISSTHISVIERGGKTPKLDTFVSIANALEVSSDYLLSDVVNYSTDSFSNELSIKLEDVPLDIRKRLLKALDAFVNEK